LQEIGGSDRKALPRPAMKACTRWTVSFDIGSNPRRARRRPYFFFWNGGSNARVAAAGLGFSAFGLRISLLLFF